jgi:hypothetical protein
MNRKTDSGHYKRRRVAKGAAESDREAAMSLFRIWQQVPGGNTLGHHSTLLSDTNENNS